MDNAAYQPADKPHNGGRNYPVHPSVRGKINGIRECHKELNRNFAIPAPAHWQQQSQA